MDPSEFRAPEAGTIVTVPEGYAAFVPAPLPPKLVFTPDLVLALSRADAALGALAGVESQLPEPRLLDAPFKRQEALCSSRIEGAEVTLSDLLLDQVGAAAAELPRSHLGEARACVATLRHGVDRLQEAPLSLELVRELHEWLLRGEIASTRTPGQFRTSQNWVGRPGSTLATAIYVAPPAPQMHECLRQWDEFLKRRGTLPDLIQAAMLHEQFEAIHPFVGGNGRLGRLLITLFLIDRRRLTRPLLYLSAYLEGRREEYYRLLMRVRTHGEWAPWLEFFLEGVRATAVQAAAQARSLIRYYDHVTARLKGDALALAKESIRSPWITTLHTRRALGIGKGAARAAVNELVQRGLLSEWTDRRPRVYLARPVLDAVLPPMEELRHADASAAAEEAADGSLIKSGLAERRAPQTRADELMAEAMRMIDTARRHRLLLRLAGGLAVRRYCADLAFIDREYSDIDFIAHSSQVVPLREMFEELGYVENRYVGQATGASQLQFMEASSLAAAYDRARRATAGGQAAAANYHPPLVDHVDIFLDVLRMDHDLDVSERLALDDYAISPADAFIAKMQIGRINNKDVHDIIALVKDVPLRSAAEEADLEISIDVDRILEVCSEDWGLYHDLTGNLDMVIAAAGDYGLQEAVLQRVLDRLATIRTTLVEADMPLAWQLRAAVGERVAWRREVEETEGTPVIAPEWDWRRDLG